MDPKAFEQLVAMAQAQPAATPVAPIDPTAALVRQPASGPVIRGPSGVVGKKKVSANPKVSERALAESAQAEQDAADLLTQLFAPQQKAIDSFRTQRSAIEAKDTAPSWALPLLGITDTWLGTDSAKKFKEMALTPEEKQAQLLALDKQIGDDEAEIAKQKIGLVKADKSEELGYAKLAQMYDRMLASQNGGGMTAIASMRYDDQMQKTLERLGNGLTGYEKSRNMKGTLTQQLGRAGKLRQILVDKDYNKLNRTQVAEFAEGIVPLITGGAMAGSEARLANFLPSNFQMSATALQDWILSNPQGAKQKGFIETVEGMLNSESKVLQRELDAEKRRTLPQYARLYRDPRAREDLYQVAAGRGIPPEEVDDFFSPKNRKKMVEEFKQTGDVPGSGALYTKSGKAVPESYRSVYEQARANQANTAIDDETLLKAVIAETDKRRKTKRK
ncbi:MAG: hypothetical protein HC841_00275 [Verrucomicrobiae bacterium]|nr:hypothetical protein [Verrucomicrobiae bacterium]